MKIEIMVSKRFRNNRTKTKRECKMVFSKRIHSRAYERAMNYRLFLSFKKWYRDNESELPFEFYIDSYIDSYCKKYLILKIRGINPDIQIQLGLDGMDVMIDVNDFTDLLGEFYTIPVREGDLYRCRACIGDLENVLYSSMDELWMELLFKQCIE